MDPTQLIGEIVERESSDQKPVEFSDTFASPTGFPQHKRRFRTSAFKQQRANQAAGGPTQSKPPAAQNERAQNKPSSSHGDFETIERQRIDQENRQRLADMTPAEIQKAQEDIMNGLNPALIQRLLQRAVIDEPAENSLSFEAPELPKEASAPAPPPPEIRVEDTAEAREQEAVPAVAPEPKTTVPATVSKKKIADDYNEDDAPAQIPEDLFPITEQPTSVHFPAAPDVPDLDPSDPNFLESLHKKYFPNHPADPSKLAWMAPVPTKDSVADKESSYYPHAEIPVAALRFDFKGRFLPPRLSRAIPSSKGLHHHGDAPEAAGYTVAELAHLARSAVPAQRCMAFQTLGRILYRLGTGEWGQTVDDPIAMGVWSSVKKGRVIESLTEAAMVQGGHMSSQAYAEEALWLFYKGGWKEKFQGR